MEAREIRSDQCAGGQSGTKHIYEVNSHAEAWDSVVTACEAVDGGWRCSLDETIFFPEGGGQNCDLGMIDNSTVTQVKEDHGVVWHYVDRPFEKGQRVHGSIDWQRRFDYMQQHSGEHIVSGIVHAKYGYNNVGFHLGDDIVTLDFDGVLNDEQMSAVEKEANLAVAQNIPVQILYPSKAELENIDYRSKIDIAGQMRLVAIEGYDICACCAPHVEKTGEIGLIKILSCTSYKGGVRLSMACGFRTLADYQMKHRQIADLGALLSVRPFEVQETVQKLHQEMQNAKYELMQVKEELVMSRILNNGVDERNMIYFDENLSAPLIKRVMQQMTERCGGYICIFSGSDGEGYQYWIGSGHLDARSVGNELKSHFECRGGGKPALIQGKIQAKRTEIENVLNKVLFTFFE